MKKQTNEIPVASEEPKYKIPASITLCYVFGLIGLFVGSFLIISGINLHNADAYIGGGFIGGSIMLFVLHYIANDIHFMSWQAEVKAKSDKDYQSFVLQHLQRIEDNMSAEKKATAEKKQGHTQYMDF